MKKLLLILTLTLSVSTLFAYDIIHPIGGRAAAMGGSSVASQGLWALQNNPAGIANLEKISPRGAPGAFLVGNRGLEPRTNRL